MNHGGGFLWKVVGFACKQAPTVMGVEGIIPRRLAGGIPCVCRVGIIGHRDADVFVAEGVGQLAGMVPAVGGVGFGGEFYGVSAAEGVAEAGAI